MVSRYRILSSVVVFIMTLSFSLRAGEAGSLRQSRQQQTMPEVSCELKVREKYRFYDIDGANVAELRKQMKKNGTTWNDGKVYAGLTSWDIRYSYDVLSEDGKSWVNSVKTDVDIVYFLPRMVSATPGSELAVLWDDYLTRLKQHEFGHKDIAVKTGTEINEVFASLATFDSHDELEREVKRRTEEKLLRLKEVQVAYDHETRHGETQGAVLKEVRMAHDPETGQGETRGTVIAAQ